MIKIAICDDENVIASQIENIIWNICKEENIPIANSASSDHRFR